MNRVSTTRAGAAACNLSWEEESRDGIVWQQTGFALDRRAESGRGLDEHESDGESMLAGN